MVLSIKSNGEEKHDVQSRGFRQDVDPELSFDSEKLVKLASVQTVIQ
jgi:hypothetical protein